MQMVQTRKPRKPWVAGLFTFIHPGLGHLYCGSWTKGIQFYLLSYFAVVIIAIFFLWLPFSKTSLVLLALLLIGVMVFIITHSIHFARQAESDYKLKPFNRWYYYLLALAVIWAAEGLFLEDFIRHSFFRAFKVPSGSMLPTLVVGDHIIVNNLTYHFREPEKNEIVTFLYPEDESKIFLKRLIGLPGDTVQIKNKVLFVNGERVKDEAYTQRIDPGTIDGTVNPRDNFGPEIVSPGSYFVLGDNRDQSLDSRFFGLVLRENVLGHASGIYWSWDDAAPLSEGIRWDRIGKRLDFSFGGSQ